MPVVRASLTGLPISGYALYAVPDTVFAYVMYSSVDKLEMQFR